MPAQVMGARCFLPPHSGNTANISLMVPFNPVSISDYI